VEAQTTKKHTKPIPCDPRNIETGVRQFLADKVTGNRAGLWLLGPELLRLGAWDLVCGWTTIFFALDADTHQPVCFTTGTSARTASSAAEELLRLAADILDTQPEQTLVLADAEHCTVELLDNVKSQTKADKIDPRVPWLYGFELDFRFR
jgi:hypothetical protein